MGYGLTQTAAPTAEPLTLDEAKNAARVDLAEEEPRVADLVAAAREYAETLTNRQLMTATWRLTLDGFPGNGDSWLATEGGPDDWGGSGGGVIWLPRPPLQSVTGITYLDTSGVTQTLATSVYVVDASREPACVSLAFGQIWPPTLSQAAAVNVTYTAGYTTAALVPRQVKLALTLLVYHWFDNPAAVGEPLTAADRLLMQASYGNY